MPENTWNASSYDQKYAFVFEYGRGVLSLLEPQPGEAILDLGCGTGHLAKAIAESGAHVVGIDGSASMIASARTAYPELEFHVQDARNFSLPTTFDAVFSNATLHWIPEAEQVVSAIARALKPGGRFVAEFGGKGNVASIITTIQQALWEVAQLKVDAGWYYPSIGEYTPLLEKHALAVSLAALFDRPTKLEAGEQGLRNWIRMFCGHMFANVEEPAVQQVLQFTEERLRGQLFRDGHWFADYKRLRVVAHKN